MFMNWLRQPCCTIESNKNTLVAFFVNEGYTYFCIYLITICSVLPIKLVVHLTETKLSFQSVTFCGLSCGYLSERQFVLDLLGWCLCQMCFKFFSSSTSISDFSLFFPNVVPLLIMIVLLLISYRRWEDKGPYVK